MTVFHSKHRLRQLVFALTLACVGATAAALPVAADQVQLTATLAGANEVPGPGQQHATGTASITVNTDVAQICYELSVENLSSPATAAHIHQGDPGTAGPVVVALTAPVNGMSSGCISVDAHLAANLAANPGAYYVNVHTADFPDGATRGQLEFAGNHLGSGHNDQGSGHDDQGSGHTDQGSGHNDHSGDQGDHSDPDSAGD